MQAAALIGGVVMIAILIYGAKRLIEWVGKAKAAMPAGIIVAALIAL